MDAQYPFASRDDIWRVLDELKEIQVAQYEQGERIARLERRRDDDARLKSLWGPTSPFPTLVAGTLPSGKCLLPSRGPDHSTHRLVVDTTFNSPPDPFKGFDDGNHHGLSTSTVGLEGEDEPRRGASRANSVRFDETANHGYYGQANRSSTELPVRTGSGMGSHPLTERSLSHRSDGRMSSSGFSHQSARTNSLGLDSRGLSASSLEASPMTPPPGLFLLGPVPSIIRCWLTTNFSNDSLLYAAVCSGSYVSSLGSTLVSKLGLEQSVMHNEDRPYIKLSLYLTEARLQQSSSRPASPQPEPQIPSVKIKFLVRQTGPEDESIQIVIGSDVLRSSNAEISFSDDKMSMVDDDGNRVCIRLVRPERDSTFKYLCTGPDTTHKRSQSSQINGKYHVGAIGQSTSAAKQSSSAPVSARLSISSADEPHRPHLHDFSDSPNSGSTYHLSATATDQQQNTSTKADGGGVWGPWRRESKQDAAAALKATNARARTMKVLRPSSRVTSASTSTHAPSDHHEYQGSHSENIPPGQSAGRASSEENRSGKAPASNPVGGASAFGWLKSGSSGARQL
ncbi:hypothetical protein N7523_001742 [Penicillium sp. IBT 18751x]|nr:hypothetical protein N7523_001742 [Penicillium sp. IBT 18751x]